MKNKKEEILKLRKQGLSIRAIQKQLGISSPSVVHHHLNHEKKIRNWLRELVVLPERFPSDESTKADCYIIAGFNEYRRILLEKIEK